jgi:hypothetical protein
MVGWLDGWMGESTPLLRNIRISLGLTFILYYRLEAPVLRRGYTANTLNNDAQASGPTRCVFSAL